MLCIYLWGILEKRREIKDIYDHTRRHLGAWFPQLPSYGGYVQRLNRMAGVLVPLLELVQPICPRTRAIIDDTAVYELAVAQGRIILTSNVKDFRPLIREDYLGIIGIPETWSAVRLDSKLTALLMREGHNFFRGRFHPLVTAGTQKQAA